MYIRRSKSISSHVNNETCFRLTLADSMFSRFTGLMFKRDMAFDQAMLITNCRWVHTCFVRFDLDLIFLNKELIVIDIKHLKPFRFTLPVKDGSYVLELRAGCTKYHNIVIGDRFVIEGTKDRQV